MRKCLFRVVQMGSVDIINVHRFCVGKCVGVYVSDFKGCDSVCELCVWCVWWISDRVCITGIYMTKNMK